MPELRFSELFCAEALIPVISDTCLDRLKGWSLVVREGEGEDAALTGDTHAQCTSSAAWDRAQAQGS